MPALCLALMWSSAFDELAFEMAMKMPFAELSHLAAETCENQLASVGLLQLASVVPNLRRGSGRLGVKLVSGWRRELLDRSCDDSTLLR